MKILRIIPFMLLACWDSRQAYGSDTDSQAGTELELEIIQLLEAESSAEPINNIYVRPVYIPDPPGYSGVVGQYECPLMFSDKDYLREVAVSYFVAHDLQIIFDKGGDNLGVVIALKETRGASEFVAYRARMDIRTSSKAPGKPDASECKVLFSAHRILGKVESGKRNLNGATYTDDEITQGLMAAFRAFASDASQRPPRQFNDFLRDFRVF